MAQTNRLPADFAHKMAHPTPHASKVAERLLAHARLCRHMASASVDEAIAEELSKMADRCVREAADAVAPGKTAEI